MVFRLDAEVLEYRVGPEAFHVVLSRQRKPSRRVSCIPSSRLAHAEQGNVCRTLPHFQHTGWNGGPSSLPGPLAAASASSPMKKSRSSVPLFAAREPPEPAPPVRYDGLLAMAGLPEPEPPDPPTPPLVAIAVGKTKEGASLPAKPLVYQRGHSRDVNRAGPSLEKPVPLPRSQLELAWKVDGGAVSNTHLSMTTAGV